MNRVPVIQVSRSFDADTQRQLDISHHMIRITNAEEFRRLLEGLAEDVGRANIHWRLYRDLHTTHGEHRHVWYQSPTFWHLTLNAHAFEAIHCLGRAFDQNLTALHLLSWLKTIEQNLHFFEVAEFKSRLAGNPFVESLAEHSRVPDRNQLAQDIELCSASDSKVLALIKHRSNIGAHRNARSTAQGRSAQAEFAISVEDLEVLMDRAHHIVNRYSSLFAASTYSRQMIGHDDYKFIFQCVQEAVERSRGRAG